MNRSIVIASAFMCLILTSCTNNSGNLTQFASPPPFDYADGEGLRSGMHRLAFAVQSLDRTLAAESDEQPLSQQSVVEDLRDIERIAKSLQDGDIRSRHPFLADEMDSFLADVERARWYASNNRYYMAGRIIGACVTCHKSNH